MKTLLLSLALTVTCTLLSFAQYPHITITQLQQVPLDSLRTADTTANFSANSNQPRWTLQTSPYIADTVVVTGLCVVPAKVITYTGGGWTMVLYDTAQVSQWGGVLVRGNSPTDTIQLIADGFLNVAAGDIINMTGVISEFPAQRGFSLTQFQPIAGKPIEIVGSGKIPKPIVKNVSDFYTGIFAGGKIQYAKGEPYEGMYVELRNLTIDNKVNLTRGTFSAVDADGNEISEYDWSHFFTLGHAGPPVVNADTAWSRIYAALGNGVRIDTIRGIISTSSGSEGPRGYRIAPIFPKDIVFGIAPPLITTHRRNPVIVPPDSTPLVSVKVGVQTAGATVQNVALYYSANGAPFTSIPMPFQASDTTYNARIPKLAVNTLVRYFIQATDNLSHSAILANSATGGFASDTSKGFFFYTVLNRPLTIRDVQTTPYINGRTPYLGAVTSLSGIITGDTAHIALSPINTGWTNAWYMQSTNQPWSGIWLTTSDTTVQKQMAALRNGDSVSVTGTVQEQFDVTRLGNITSVTKFTSGNPEPAPVVLTTASFNVGNGSPSAEPYESMLVRFNNVKVSDINPTFSDPTEYSLTDGSGAVVTQQGGRNKYSNLPADTVFGKTILKLNDRLSSITGIIYYSFNQYKFVPRSNSDFGTLTDVPPADNRVMPSQYTLSQNYPNPFNPTTKLGFGISHLGFVTLKVYDVLGREVASLVNEVKQPGVYTVEWDARRMASGVYFYRLVAGDYVQNKKMLLLK